jgi:2-polyprenyl-6-methoxyphenol hydroxylase-like FAD-dependent oxidoreductase
MKQPRHVIIVGGSVAGLGAALALSNDGQRVTVLESDATPMPANHLEAFERWDRRGSPQVRHSHAFLGRLYCLLRDRAPGLLAKLLASGASELRFDAFAKQIDPNVVFQRGDEDIVLLACRRITFEYVLRRHVIDSGLVDFRDGEEVTGLSAARDERTGLQRVDGVHVKRKDGARETLHADLVVDASGRRSKLGDWLEAIGAPRPREESEPCGIFYSSRFYRLRPGAARPEMHNGVGQDLGYLKVGLFPGDGDIFSLTLAAAPEDDALRSVLRTPGFEAAVAALPITIPWVSPEVAEPISDVHGMANLRNTRRWLVEKGAPLALGVAAIGDASMHSNPIVGRGCSLAWVSAFLLADALREEPDDARALALRFDASIEREVVPWYKSQLAMDRDAIEVQAMHRRGEDPFRSERPDGTQDPKAFTRALMRDGLGHALREDVGVLRAFMRVLNLLDPPEDVLQRPEILQAVLRAWNDRHNRPPLVLGPSRDEMLDLLRRAA